MAGLNITHDASRCSAFILSDPEREYRPKPHKGNDPSSSEGSLWFSFEQSIVFHIAMPVSVIVKCLVTDAPYKVFERSYGGTLSLEAPPGLIYS